MRIAVIAVLGLVFAGGLGTAAHLIARDTVALPVASLDDAGEGLAPTTIDDAATTEPERRAPRATTSGQTTTGTTTARTSTEEDDRGRGPGRGRGRGGDSGNSGSGSGSDNSGSGSSNSGSGSGGGDRDD